MPAFEALVRRFERPLFRFLFLRTGSKEDAEELAQDSFVRAWQQIDRYDPERPFSTWLFTLGRRLAASRLRLVKRSRPMEESFEPYHETDPPRLLGSQEERENLWSAARRLCAPDACSALWLRHAEDLSIRDIARVLGRREAGVRVLMFRARARLARHLSPDPGSRAIRATARISSDSWVGGHECSR